MAFQVEEVKNWNLIRVLMRIRWVEVENLGPVRRTSFTVRGLTHLVGPNGAGKSTLLRAFRLFFEGSSSFTQDDIHMGNQDLEPSVTLEFDELTKAETERFDELLIDGKLRIMARVGFGGSRPKHTYHRFGPINEDFEPLWTMLKAELLENYARLQSEDKYSDLPKVKQLGEAKKALKDWLTKHENELPSGPDLGNPLDPDQSKLIQSSMQFVFIPALEDGAREVGDNGRLTKLIEEVAAGHMFDTETLDTLEKANKLLAPIVEKRRVSVETNIDKSLNNEVGALVKHASLKLRLDCGELERPLVSAALDVTEHGYSGKAHLAGHGVQRSLLVAAARYKADTEHKSEDERPRMLLCIEEPELFQHPSQQRHLSRLFVKMAGAKDTEGNPTTDENIQIVSATHSPAFPSVQWFDCVRRVSRDSVDKTTSVSESNWEDVVVARARLENRLPQAPTQAWMDSELARLRKSLKVASPVVSEGFFAGRVVLVEGVSDAAALSAHAEYQNLQLDGEDIVVLPVDGKQNILIPYLVFRELGIECYLMWDSDESRPEEEARNRKLLDAVGADNLAPFPGRIVNSTWAVHKEHLEATLRHELGDGRFQDILNQIAEEYGVPANDRSLKSGEIMYQVVARLLKEGTEIPFLLDTLAAIRSM